MRMKYLQVAMEVVEQLGPDLGTLLYPRARREDAEARAGWGLLKMIRWALGRCPDDAPPSANAVVHGPDAARLIAAAAGYRGRDPEAFVDACTRLMPSPLLERVDGGIRVRGLDRYDAAWRERRRKGGAEAEDSPPGPRRDPAGTPPGTHRTEAEAEASSTKTLTPAAGAAPAPQLPLDGLPAGAGSESSGDPVEVVRKAWNEVAERRQLPSWRQTSKDRRKAVLNAIRARKVQGCLALVAAVDASPFLRGEKTDFRAFPDWLFDEKNAAKVAEGNYAERGPPASVQAQAPPRREPKNEAERLWFEVVGQMRDFGKNEIARQLDAGDLRARLDGETLVIAQGEKLYMSWVRGEYGELLQEAAAAKGINLILEDMHANEDAQGRAGEEAKTRARAASG